MILNFLNYAIAEIKPGGITESMFGFLHTILGKIGLGISSILVAVAGFVSPAPVKSIQSNTPTSTVEVNIAAQSTATTTQTNNKDAKVIVKETPVALPATHKSVSVVDDKFAGEKYYNTYRDCSELSKLNVDQYAYCLEYVAKLKAEQTEILPSQVSAPTQPQTSDEILGTVTFSELKGSYQGRFGETILYFSASNSSNYEAHVNALIMKFQGYGYKAINTEGEIALQDNTGATLGKIALQPNSTGPTIPVNFSVNLTLDQPLVIYENSKRNFRIIVSPQNERSSQINAATIESVKFGGFNTNYSIGGLPLTVYPATTNLGGAPTDY